MKSFISIYNYIDTILYVYVYIRIYACIYICTLYIHRFAENLTLFSVRARGRGAPGRRGGAAPLCGAHWGTSVPSVGRHGGRRRRAAPAGGDAQGCPRDGDAAVAVATPRLCRAGWVRRASPGGRGVAGAGDFRGMRWRAAPGARLRPSAAHPSSGHGGILGTGFILLGVLWGPFFNFLLFLFCLFLSFFFFSLFSPPAPFTGHAILGASPRSLSSHGCIADPSRRPPMTCPPGGNPALHRGCCPRAWQSPVGVLLCRDVGGTGTRGHLDTALNRERGGRGAFRARASPRREEQAVRTPPLLCPLPRLFQSLSSSGENWGAKWVQVGGADHRPRHWPPRVNRSAPLLRLQRLEDLGLQL